jgi:signal peptidase I
MADTNPLNLPPGELSGTERAGGKIEPWARPSDGAAATSTAGAAPGRSLWRRWFGSSTPPPGQQNDSVREVVETIVFVVVLVLMLKSFAAEAFVIPTGSMAETLWGYQKVVQCPECGIKFPVNCSQEVDPSDGGRPQAITGCTCPNCRQHLLFPDAPPGVRSGRRINDPGWSSGDRVLVSKFVYDLFGRSPERLDVVVFKYPGDDFFPQTGPHKAYVPMNYIKRLIGLPQETIAIHGGNIYILDADSGPQYDDYDKALQDPQAMAQLWQKRNMHVDAARNLFPGKFRILRKPPDKVLSTMRLVYDNDHPAPKLPARWTGEGWTSAKDNSLQASSSGEEKLWLRYQHLLRDAPDRPALITDFLGYNSFETDAHDSGHIPQENWVGDLVLECEVVVDRTEGELTLELCKGVDRFQARFDLSSGVCSLYRKGEEGSKLLGSQPTRMQKKGTYRLRLANVDERLIVWVDGRLPFEDGAVYEPPADTGPRKENDLEPAGIGLANGAAVTVRKLKLHRDLYYTTSDAPSQPDVAGINFRDPSTWDDLSRMPTRTYYVQPDHFLCLGDNSQESSDGRTWGLVPRRLMLGRALQIYYPFSRFGRIR